MGVACGNWRLLLGDRLYWARGRIGFSQRLDERLVDRNQDETEVVSSTFFNGSVFFFFFLVKNMCRQVSCRSLVQYTQAPNELAFLPGFGCLAVVVFMASNLM